MLVTPPPCRSLSTAATLPLWHPPILLSRAQARITFQPLVLPAEAAVALAPLAQCTGLRSLALHDAPFVRRPWTLTLLAPLTQLRELCLAYDSALWAPGACAAAAAQRCAAARFLFLLFFGSPARLPALFGF